MLSGDQAPFGAVLPGCLGWDSIRTRWASGDDGITPLPERGKEGLRRRAVGVPSVVAPPPARVPFHT